MAPTRTTLATLLLAALLVLLVPDAAGAGVVVTRVDQPAASVRDYWTRQRMREAEPVPLPTPDQRSARWLLTLGAVASTLGALAPAFSSSLTAVFVAAMDSGRSSGRLNAAAHCTDAAASRFVARSANAGLDSKPDERPRR